MKITFLELIELLSTEPDKNVTVDVDICSCGYCIEGWLPYYEKAFREKKANNS